MSKWTFYGSGLVALTSLTPTVWAQIPGVAGPAAPAAVAGVAAPPPANLWSFLGLTKEQKEECKRKCCQTKIGQMLNQTLKPVAIMSGGMVGNLCPEDGRLKDLQEDLAKGGAEGAAAAIKIEEAQAAARRAAVRYLGTVDCYYWGPEVEPALVDALRGDRNECVRWEAALALGRGCCCTKVTIRGLADALSSRPSDAPRKAEKSERVRAAAAVALAHCLTCYQEITEPKKEDGPKPEPPTPEPAPSPDKAAQKSPNQLRLSAYVKETNSLPTKQLLQEAKAILQEREQQFAAAHAQHPASILDLFHKSSDVPGTLVSQTPAAAATPSAEPPPAYPAGEIKPVSSTPAPVPAAKPATPVQRTSQKATPAAAQVATVAHKAAAPVAAPIPVYAAPAPVQQVSVTAPAAPVALPVVAAQLPVYTAPGVVRPSSATTVPSMATSELVALLRTSVYPDVREAAAQRLGSIDVRMEPTVVQVLLRAAREDTAPLVRVACIRSLAQLKVSSAVMMSTLEALKTDRDIRVRLAVDEVLGKADPSVGDMSWPSVSNSQLTGAASQVRN